MNIVKKIVHTILNFIKRLSDVRFLGQVVFVVLVLLISWSTTTAIQQNYEVQKRVAAKQKEIELQKLKNENLKVRNRYLETDEFLEITARRQLGKALPGERLVVIPKEVALRHTVESSVKSDNQVQEQADSDKPWYQQNLEDWGRFFFKR